MLGFGGGDVSIYIARIVLVYKVLPKNVNKTFVSILSTQWKKIAYKSLLRM